MKYSLVIYLLVLSFGQQLVAQDLAVFKAAFAKSATYYKQLDNYTLNMSYAFYSDTARKEADETMTGVVIKKQEDYFSKIHQTETLFIQGEYVKVNHQEKAVLYGKIAQNTQPQTPIAIEQVLQFCKEAKQLTSGSTLVFEVSMHPQFGLPYSKMLVELDKTTYAIKRQEIYLAPGQSYPWQSVRSKVTTTPAKMVILLEDAKPDIDPSIFSLSNYISQGKSVSLAQQLSTYKLYDTTKK